MRTIILLICTAVLLATSGCIIRDDDRDRGDRGHWDHGDHFGDYHDHDDYHH